MDMEPKEKLLKLLNRTDFATLDEAADIGVTKITLSRMVAAGTLYRPAKRIYTATTDWLTDSLRKYAPACTLYPDAVVCGVSALLHYELTDEQEHKIWLAFPRKHRIINQEYRVVYLREPSYSLGLLQHRVGKHVVRIYVREKTIVDAFKMLPIDVAHKALRGYLRLKDRDLTKLSRYAKQMHKPLDDIVATLLSDE